MDWSLGDFGDEKCHSDVQNDYMNTFRPYIIFKLLDIIEEKINSNKTNKSNKWRRKNCKTIINRQYSPIGESPYGDECPRLYKECTNEDADSFGKLSKIKMPK